MLLELYHGTKLSSAENIINEGFHCKPQIDHWLGNGAYFYFAKELAEWWTTNPSRKFGVKTDIPAIVNVKIEIPDENILDLRSLGWYQKCLEWYDQFFGAAMLNLEEYEEHNIKRFRCSFFDWILFHSNKNISCIIGNFGHEDQYYLTGFDANAILGMRKFHLPFIETQVCIKEELITPDMISIC